MYADNQPLASPRKDLEEIMSRARLMSMDEKCYEKATERGQLTFTLVEQDQTMPQTICFWILQNIGKAKPEKLRLALEEAIVAAESNVQKKHAD